MRKFISNRILVYFALLLLGISGFSFTVILPQPAGFYGFVAIAALGGFGVSAMIAYTKRSGKHLVCPVGSDCNAVVTSKYSRFFGIHLEYLGMTYFAAIFFVYGIMLFLPGLISGIALSFVALLTTGAFFFSSYLLFVQAFLLRQWCIWCILAAMLSMTIFFISLISQAIAVSFLANGGEVLAMLQSLGFALGLGGSTAAVFLFSKFLQDKDIDSKELSVLKGVSELVWVGLVLILMSNFAQYVTNPEALAQSSVFLAQILSLFVVAVAGAVLMIIFAPLLSVIPFTDGPQSSLASLRKPTFIIGAVALSSWYFAFATNHVPGFHFMVFLATYGTILVTSVAISMLWERSIRKGALK
ncbi:MAG: vitamin K epoxide reductase family protein [Candidatus Yanofskybacteria bacterium]|nr:vitamin K epoxide reductase family protein [Candidatus Yanofskybacteria bacterium]